MHSESLIFTASMSSNLIICKNCGAAFSGHYCNQCGEKLYTEKDKAASHIFEEVVHFLTHFDSKFFKTLFLFFRRPGFVSKDYCAGKRKKYFKPVSLFLVGVVIYLFFPLLEGLNISFENHINNNNTFGIRYTQNWADAKMHKQQISKKALAEKFNHTSPKVAKLFLFVLLPLSALWLNLIFKKKRRYFFDHFILSTEINTALLFLLFTILPLLFIALAKAFHFHGDYGDQSIAYDIAEALLILVLLSAAFRRFYEVSLVRAVLQSVVFLLGFLLALFIYRQLVFCAVMLIV